MLPDAKNNKVITKDCPKAPLEVLLHNYQRKHCINLKHTYKILETGRYSDFSATDFSCSPEHISGLTRIPYL